MEPLVIVIREKKDRFPELQRGQPGRVRALFDMQEVLPTEKHFRGGCDLALITSQHKKKMLLPANGTEKCTSGYCNHNNTFRSSETENDMPDKHMLFLIKNGFVLCGPHHLQGYAAKAEQGRTQCLQEALLCPSCTPNTHSPGLQILCPSHAAKRGWKSVSLCCPCINHSVLPGTARVLNVLSGYLGITSFGQNRDLVRHFCCDLALTVHLLRCEIGCMLSIFRGLNAPSADVLWTDSNLFCGMDEMRLEDKHCHPGGFLTQAQWISHQHFKLIPVKVRGDGPHHPSSPSAPTTSKQYLSEVDFKCCFLYPVNRVPKTNSGFTRQWKQTEKSHFLLQQNLGRLCSWLPSYDTLSEHGVMQTWGCLIMV